MGAGDASPMRGSVTTWISQIRVGNEEAARKLWARFNTRLKALANRVLKNSRIRIADEEDLANDALGLFLMSIQTGKYTDLDDREGLWRLLARITINRANSLIRDEKRGKRDFRKTIGEGDLSQSGQLAVASREPSPDADLLFAELINHFLNILDGDLPAIALARREGKSNSEIAEMQGVSVPTIERRIRLIRLSLENTLEKECG